MRTKTVLLSALVGALGSVAAMAQTNVYSLNAVGYINVTCYPGFNLIACPLICSPDNTVNTLMNNSNGSLTGTTLSFYNPVTLFSSDQAAPTSGKGSTTNANGWAGGGTNTLNPGQACWFENNSSPASNIVLQFVGQVPTVLNYNLTNTLVAGFNLVSSIEPAAGDLCTNIYPTTNAGGQLFTNVLGGLTNYNVGDVVYTYDGSLPASNAYTTFQSGSGKGQGGFGYNLNWAANGDPVVARVGLGFWYQNNGPSTVNWVESYSVNQ
jgi:hypothetical protein